MAGIAGATTCRTVRTIAADMLLGQVTAHNPHSDQGTGPAQDNEKCMSPVRIFCDSSPRFTISAERTGSSGRK